MKWLKQSRFDYSLNEPMSEHTSLRVGGPADYWIRVKDPDELEEVITYLHRDRIPRLVVGAGNNLLVRDGGVEGAVIRLQGKGFQYIKRIPEGLRIGGGVPLQRLVGLCISEGLSGCEFLVSIPGTLGGAIHMNVGTRDRTISEEVIEVTVMDSDGQVRCLTRDKIAFGYRESGLADSIVLEAVIRTLPSDPQRVRRCVASYWSRKKSTQDLTSPSAGSVFKNTLGGLVPSGRLIEMSRLKGFRVGGATISPIHANFIVNDRGGTAHDIETLISIVQERVFEDHGVKMELEICVVGRKGEAAS